MNFYRVIWKPESKNGKGGIREDVLVGREQYLAHCTEVELIKVENDGVYEDSMHSLEIAA